MIADCGHEVEPGRYGHLSPKVRACFDCCTMRDEIDLLTAETFVAYLSGDGYTIKNWPGHELMRVTWLSGEHTGYTPTGGYYTYLFVNARDLHGQWWHGRSEGRGMITRLRRTKEATRA